jgi:hypothetical protein
MCGKTIRFVGAGAVALCLAAGRAQAQELFHPENPLGPNAGVMVEVSTAPNTPSKVWQYTLPSQKAHAGARTRPTPTPGHLAPQMPQPYREVQRVHTGADYTRYRYTGADYTGYFRTGADYTDYLRTGADYTGNDPWSRVAVSTPAVRPTLGDFYANTAEQKARKAKPAKAGTPRSAP